MNIIYLWRTFIADLKKETKSHEIQVIEISTEFITLGQLLKFTGIVSNGSDVKLFLANNDVLINEISDNRRGRKLYHNDIVSINKKEVEMKIFHKDN
ncbi:MAG: S4 domain-containing protein YaaA [Mycoplasma sp.]